MKKLLLVDDSSNSLENVLPLYDFDVTVAKSKAEAINILDSETKMIKSTKVPSITFNILTFISHSFIYRSKIVQFEPGVRPAVFLCLLFLL